MTERDKPFIPILMIESIIDYQGLEKFLTTVAQLCNAKAIHIAENWQDAPLAKRWAKVSEALEPVIAVAKGL